MSRRELLDVDGVISFLREVELKLLEIDADELDQDDKNRLARALNAVTTVQNQFLGANLKDLNAKFEEIEKDLRQGAGKLEKDLASLETTVLAIKTVASGIETMSEIVKAFRLPV